MNYLNRISPNSNRQALKGVYLRNTQEKLHNTQHTILNTHTFLTHKWTFL
jgi:hypothetical protein